MASSEIDDFLAGPLVNWFVSRLEDPNALATYDDLTDGVLLHSVFLQINPEPLYDEVVPSNGNPVIRTKNLTTIVQNLKQFYKEKLDKIIMLPDTVNLGEEPELHIADMEDLLFLLLGCAVIQCPNKNLFAKRKILDVTQHEPTECTQQKSRDTTLDDNIDISEFDEIILREMLLDVESEDSDNMQQLPVINAEKKASHRDIKYYQSIIMKRIEELRNDNIVLRKENEMLKEQITLFTGADDTMLNTEYEIITLNHATFKENYQEIVNLNSQLNHVLHELQKAAASEITLARSSNSEESMHNDNGLSKQLISNAQAIVVEINLKIHRLETLVDSLKKSLHRNLSCVFELKKENKMLSSKIESLNDTKKRLEQQTANLKLVCDQELDSLKRNMDQMQIKFQGVREQFTLGNTKQNGPRIPSQSRSSTTQHTENKAEKQKTIYNEENFRIFIYFSIFSHFLLLLMEYYS